MILIIFITTNFSILIEFFENISQIVKPHKRVNKYFINIFKSSVMTISLIYI